VCDRAAIRQRLELRVARHTGRLDEIARFYGEGLGLPELGGFRGHDGYDGVFFGVPGTGTHLEFTTGGDSEVPSPHPESLLVLYVGDDETARAICRRAGAEPVEPANPYWATHGITIEDPDGFRIVLAPARWESTNETSIGWFDGDRERLADLFSLADDSPLAVSAYRDLGRVLVATEDDHPVGHVQLVDAGPTAVELKSIAVREDRQRRGIGRLLVERALAEARADGFTTMLVATAAAGTEVLRFYQLLGFRLLRVERDAFTAADGYPPIDLAGIPLRDRVWLSRDL
jgi:ribosomal protein S18 acetylase RimI-like enzyme